MPDTVSQVGTFRNFYAGREYDDFTGLYYNRARWYDPQAARFISQDPISFAGGDTNLYRYAGNSPDNATDPSGQIIFVVAPILIFGGGLLVGAAHGYADTIAANRDAGALEIGVGVGLGGLFGALNPVGEFFSAGGAIAGGLIEKSQGGDFLGTGFQAGGLGGGLLGGFGTAARHAVRNAGVFGTRQLAGIGLRNGAMAVAPELAGATVGAGYGYYETGTLAGTLHRAQQGLFVGGSASGIYSLGRAGVRKFNQHFEVTVDRSHFYLGMNAGPLNWRLNRKGTKLADSPTAFGTPYKQLSAQRIQLLEAKEADRTITKSDWKHLQWQRRLTDRRQAGVDAFWAQERQLLTQGLPGTRNWNEAARNAIISGQQPRGIFSHHKYSVSQYPQLANDPSNVFPVTMFEHFQKWHGGNWQNATHGVPIRPNLPDSF